MLIAQETVTREGISRRQRGRDRDDRIHQHIGYRIEVAVVPGRIGEYFLVVFKREIPRPQGKDVENFVRRLERHIHQPVNRQHQEQDVKGWHQPGRFSHYWASFRIIRV
jgi:hypothetical protein